MELLNPIQVYWKERIEKLPINIQNQLEELQQKGHLTDELILIEKKRPSLKSGDVFVVQPKKDIYFYGLILNVCSTKICKCKVVACIFKNITNEKNMDKFNPDFNNLLLPPLSLFKEPWTSGYFYNIGHIDMDTINVPTYGFYHMSSKRIVSEIGECINEIPELIGLTALDGVGAVAFKIKQELIIDPSILNGNDKTQSDFCLKFPEILARATKNDNIVLNDYH